VAVTTVATLITDPLFNNYERFIIIDARSPPEFSAGRIKKAINAQDLTELMFIFNESNPDRVCIIFHCEFTSKRAPALAQAFRNHDRVLNLRSERPFAFTETYLMEGGFCEFFRTFPHLCTGTYVREEACRRLCRRATSDAGAGFRDRPWRTGHLPKLSITPGDQFGTVKPALHVCPIMSAASSDPFETMEVQLTPQAFSISSPFDRDDERMVTGYMNGDWTLNLRNVMARLEVCLPMRKSSTADQNRRWSRRGFGARR
jgi:rhodanese-related sulfurtransferase